jgi:isopentenyl-diphosphate delta-isomerase type 1
VLQKHHATTDTQYGIDMDQEQMMESDKLIAVNEYDEIIVGEGDNNNNNNNDDSSTELFVSKRTGHTFTISTPRDVLHRAFSLFIFDKYNRLLLTQRSSNKITFPNVWTNTVCSHPLYDMIPNEVDYHTSSYINNDTTFTKNNLLFPGIKYAAIRKCYHELGIQSQHVQHNKIQFITRYHYWAADTITHGPNTFWGEHKVDYLLFLQLDTNDTNINTNNNNNTIDDYDKYLSTIIQPNPDEVATYKFVTQDELRTMIYNDNNTTTTTSTDSTEQQQHQHEQQEQQLLLWSPWFIGILERGGWDYWTNLQLSLQGLLYK